MTTRNPFEPPRTTDLDGDRDGARSASFLPDEARQELIAGAIWVRWAARMTSVSIAVGIASAVANVFRASNPATKMVTLLSVAVGSAVSTIFLILLRRYATASDQLRAGTGAVAPIFDAQSSLFKLLGLLTIVALSLLVLLLVAGYAVARLGLLR